MDIPSTSNTSSLNFVSAKDAKGSKGKTGEAGAKWSVVELDHCYSRPPWESGITLTTLEEKPVLKRVATSYVAPEPPARKVSKPSSTGNILPSYSSSIACQLDQVVQVASVVEVETSTFTGEPEASSSTAARSKSTRGKKARSIEARRLMNKESARKSREAKKARLEYLQEELDNLKMQNLLLNVQNVELTNKICDTEEENEMLRELLSGGVVPVADNFRSYSDKTWDLENVEECVTERMPENEFEFVPAYLELDSDQAEKTFESASAPAYFELDSNQAIFDTDDDS